MQLLSSFLVFLSQDRPRYGKGSYTKPFNSAAGIPEDVALVILVFAVLFFGYVAFKVRQGIKTKGDLQQSETVKSKAKKKTEKEKR